MSVTPSPTLLDEHLAQVAAVFDRLPAPSWSARAYSRILARYYRLLVPEGASVLEIGCGAGDLLAQLPNRDVTGVDVSATQLARARAAVPHGQFHRQAGEHLALERRFEVIILSDTLNLAGDVQGILTRLHSVSHERTRLVINIQNQLWRPVLAGAALLGQHRHPGTNNWLARSDVINLCHLTDWEVVTTRHAVLCPWRAEHTSQGETSTILFAPTEGRTLGWFHCSHSHCAVSSTLARDAQ